MQTIDEARELCRVVGKDIEKMVALLYYVVTRMGRMS